MAGGALSPNEGVGGMMMGGIADASDDVNGLNQAKYNSPDAEP